MFKVKWKEILNMSISSIFFNNNNLNQNRNNMSHNNQYMKIEEVEEILVKNIHRYIMIT